MLALLPLVLVLASCGMRDSDSGCAALAGGAYCLQPTTVLAPFSVQQKAEATVGETRATMIAEIESDNEGLRFVGLTPMGQTLLQVGYDNRAATARLLPDSRLSATLLVAFLQIALWPSEAVRAGLKEPLTLEDDGAVRRIRDRGDVVMSVAYAAGGERHRRMRFSIPAMGVSVDVETLDEMAREQ
ncbi:MAG: DUF3261 domain-containing protein [Ignavibacteria bacterium]